MSSVDSLSLEDIVALRDRVVKHVFARLALMTEMLKGRIHGSMRDKI